MQDPALVAQVEAELANESCYGAFAKAIAGGQAIPFASGFQCIITTLPPLLGFLVGDSRGSRYTTSSCFCCCKTLLAAAKRAEVSNKGKRRKKEDAQFF